jgi:glycogen debranching enzyme
VLQRVKMIAEPWDLGPDGYQVGQFPSGWLDWNDRFRDTARAFWLGGACTRGQFAQRLAGSADLLQHRARSPVESVNYVVSHDGFTLADLVSYNDRHNLANGESNRDGHGNNLSWNCGVEGPSADLDVQRLRGQLQRALLATVLLSQGTPMLAAGDEMGHSQAGNNNPYCQDNDITWIDWSRPDADLLAFTQHLVALRRRWLPLGTTWYTGQSDGTTLQDLAWLNSDGQTLTTAGWQDPNDRRLVAWIGRPGGTMQALLLVLNGNSVDSRFTLPPGRWVTELDTAQARGCGPGSATVDGSSGRAVLKASARSLLLLRDADGPPPPGAAPAA